MAHTMPLVVTGDIMGDLDKAIVKLKKVNAALSKTNTEVPIFVAGDFFGELPASMNEYIKGASKVPFHIYTLGPVTPLQHQFLKALMGNKATASFNNVTVLGKYGVIQLAEGLTIAYVGGTEGTECNEWTFTRKDTKVLLTMCEKRKIDVLITYQWPYGIEYCAKNAPWNCPPMSSKLISHLVIKLRPRMHFAANAKMAYSSPYMRYEGGNPKTDVTTFIGLTDLNNYKNSKWVFGMNFPLKAEEKEGVILELPYYNILSSEQLLSCVMEEIGFDTKRKGNEREGDRGHRTHPDIDLSCWFCLGNPKVNENLVLTIGKHIYLALSKGPITDLHVLLLPIQHVDRMADADNDIQEEADVYLDHLSSYYETQGRKMVWFEKGITNQHFQIECVGVDIDKFHVMEKCMKAVAKESNVDLIEQSLHKMSLTRTLRVFDNYFHMQIGHDKGFSIDVPCVGAIPMNFGRQVIVKTMGEVERLYWGLCVRELEEIEEEADSFRQKWADFCAGMSTRREE